MPREPLWSMSHRRPSSAWSSTKWFPLPSVPTRKAASLRLRASRDGALSGHVPRAARASPGRIESLR
jgi:hypothetical protein